MNTPMRMEDLTDRERAFLNAYREKPEHQEQVDEMLGVAVDFDEMSDDEFVSRFSIGLFMQALDWITDSPDEMPIPKPAEDSTIGERIFAFGVNACCFGFLKGAEMAMETKK